MSAIDNLSRWGRFSWTKKVFIVIPVFALVMCQMYFSHNKEAEETRKEITAMRSIDAACVSAANKYADECFKDNYRMSKHNSGVRALTFVACMNERSSVKYFSVDKS